MPNQFVSLCALPKTDLLQSYCATAYLEELKQKHADGHIVIDNPAANTYTVDVTSMYKKSFVWKMHARFEVQEYEEPALVITEIIIYADDEQNVALHLTFKYNTNPKSLQYQWGEFVDIKEVLVTNDSYYMLALAALETTWLHDIVFAKATRRRIQVQPRHVNVKPKFIHNLEPIVNAVQQKIDIRVEVS